jgi:hypothetical protein
MKKLFLCLLLMTSWIACGGDAIEEVAEPAVSAQDFTGRWDVTVEAGDGGYPSWFELVLEEDQWTGRFVGRSGSARPIVSIEQEGNSLKFSLPIQYESNPADLTFQGQLEGDRLQGTTNAEDSSEVSWTAVRAPELPARENPQWGEPIALFNGEDLSGWKLRDPDGPNSWTAKDGILSNTGRGNDLITEAAFGDFRLTMEFRYPPRSNSGVYLRGRYELQIQDSLGREPASRALGGVYGFVSPESNAAKAAGEWQSYDITLLGRHISVVLNGEAVIQAQEIPGITGGALDSDEGSPGPILLQGDHGQVEFRNIMLSPVVDQ